MNLDEGKVEDGFYGSAELEAAAELLLADYENDEELTAFTVLDGEDFYEEG